MNFLDETYETFCYIGSFYRVQFNALIFGQIKEKYLEHEWNRKPKKWIDPQKEANANKNCYHNGAENSK